MAPQKNQCEILGVNLMNQCVDIVGFRPGITDIKFYYNGTIYDIECPLVEEASVVDRYNIVGNVTLGDFVTAISRLYNHCCNAILS